MGVERVGSNGAQRRQSVGSVRVAGRPVAEFPLRAAPSPDFDEPAEAGSAVAGVPTRVNFYPVFT